MQPLSLKQQSLQNVVILGSTGSIGESTLSVIDANLARY